MDIQKSILKKQNVVESLERIYKKTLFFIFDRMAWYALCILHGMLCVYCSEYFSNKKEQSDNSLKIILQKVKFKKRMMKIRKSINQDILERGYSFNPWREIYIY